MKKYHQANGTRGYAYLPHNLHELIVPGGTLVVVEGEFKAMALCESGIPAVGITGITMAIQSSNEKQPTQ